MSNKFRKKPVEIEAVQFDGANWREIREFIGVGQFFRQRLTPLNVGGLEIAEVYDELHDTFVGVSIGDWIIRGVEGEFYPCNSRVFEATYEAVA